MDTIGGQLEDDVRAEIARDPRIRYPSEIAVAVVDRVAILHGVTGVTNEIRVDEAR